MPDLLLEIHSDEIPARMQADAGRDLKKILEESLRRQVSPTAEVVVHVTPNRMCAVCESLPDQSAEEVMERRGPRVGSPSQAVEGFARSANVAIEELQTKEVASGTYYFAVKVVPGQPIDAIVAEIVPGVIENFPWPKSMRWGTGQLRWVRPINSILCILYDGAGSRAVDFSVGNLKAGDRTAGHRIMAPQQFKVASFADYRNRLERAFVTLDASDRLNSIRVQIRALAEKAGLEIIEDDALLHENAGLTEWPVAGLGTIDMRHSELPEEILISAIRAHLKFICLRSPKTGRISHFISVANRSAADGNKTILNGNIRVVDARLGDAEFAWSNDLRRFGAEGAVKRLRADLNRVTYHRGLGSLGQRVERIRKLAVELAPLAGADPAEADQAAEIAKLDLVSGTVGEFPELQGAIGRRLASHLDYPENVCLACEEHYFPAGRDGSVPRAPVSVAVAIADKIDHLVGLFGIGLPPTGSKDPFALRRAALGLVRLMLDNGLRLPLRNFLRIAGRQFAGQDAKGFSDAKAAATRVESDLMDFLHDRLLHHLTAQGVRQDAVMACISACNSDDFHLVSLKARALQDFLEVPGNEILFQGYRRANNILKALPDSEAVGAADCDPNLFAHEEEVQLHASQQAAAEAIKDGLASGNVAAAVNAISLLVAPINAFFENVMVNCEDHALRANRHKLLSSVRSVTSAYADLSVIETKAG